MAIETKKIIEISTAGAVTSVRELKDEINSLRDAWLNAEEGTEEYENITNQLIEDQKKLNDVMRIGKNEASAATGSYNSLVNQMAALKTAWRSTTSEVQRSQLGDKIRAINDQLKEYDASIGNHQRKVGSYEQALQALTKSYDSQKQELAALKTALDNLEPGTDAYNEAFERAAELTHNLQERQEQLRMSANDLGTQLSNVANIGAGMVGAFNSVNAIMTLTGTKNEDLQKTMVKLQAGIALVQGLKGIDGAVKSMKAYASWAAKAYDSIKNWISGSKSQQKQIEATTKAAEANATVNNQVAASEGAVGAGATTMNAGLKGAAGGFNIATAAATAFKAVLMSLGIGIIVAAVSALVTALGKLAGEWLNAGDKARENAYNIMSYIDETQQNLLEKEEERFSREVEMAKAKGATEMEVLEMYRDFYDRVYNGFITKDEEVINGVSANLRIAEANIEAYQNAYKDILENNPTKKLRKEDRKEWERDVNKWLGIIKVYKDNSNSAIKEIELNHKESFERIMEDGVRSYGDILKVLQWYKAGAQEVADNYQFNPIGANENDIQVELQNIVKDAEDANKSEIQIENESYQKRKEMLEKYGIDTTNLTLAHNNKVRDIVTAATQSIIDSAKEANQSQLANLQETEEKELRELRKYGQLKKQITVTNEEGVTKVITVEEAVRAKYAKERRQIEYNNDVKKLENIIKFTEQEIATYKQTYDELVALGAEKAADTERIQEEEHAITTERLQKQFAEWKKLYEQYKDDVLLTEEQRLSIKEKYLNAEKALEKEQTDYFLKQVKTRQKAREEEIEDIKKELKFNETSNEMSQGMKDLNGATGWGGFWNVFGGGSQNPSYKKQQEQVNQKYDLQIGALQQEFDVYQRVIDDMNATDAERTAAMEKQKDLRSQIYDLETKKVTESATIQINKQKELISTIVDVGNSIGDILGSVADAWEANVQAQLAAGKISQEEADRQLENMRALQITQAVINTIAGSIGAFTQASQTIPPPYGQIVGAAAAAAVLAAGYAQIAQIKAANKDSNLSSTTQMSPTMPTVSDFNPTYTANMTGKDDTEYLNELFSQQRLFVSVTDINSTQARVKTTEQESSF